mgnify:CR=1 FL=1
MTIPFTEVGKQLIAGGIIAVVVVGGRLLVGESLTVVVLVTVGGGTYFAALWGLSSEFRTTVASNLPI